MTPGPDFSALTPFPALGINSTKVGFFNVFSVPGPELFTFSVIVGMKE